MGMKIKKDKHGKQPKIKKSAIEEQKIKAACPEHVVFCFRYITHNNSYNFKYFKSSQQREKERTICNLYSKLEEVSRMSWRDFQSLPKEVGMETIPINRLKFEQHQDLIVTEDQKYISIRFESQNKRIIGIKASNCPIMHIIGYDFDYSAYDH
jgi:hypothetical protein